MPRQPQAPSAPLYTLTLTEAQARVLVAALDVFGRIHMGQFDTAIMDVWGLKPGTDWARRDAARPLLDAAARLMTGLPTGSSFGIGSEQIPDEARVAYDVQQVVRHRLAWDFNADRGRGFGSIWYDEPMRWSAEALPTIARLDGSS